MKKFMPILLVFSSLYSQELADQVVGALALKFKPFTITVQIDDKVSFKIPENLYSRIEPFNTITEGLEESCYKGGILLEEKQTKVTPNAFVMAVKLLKLLDKEKEKPRSKYDIFLSAEELTQRAAGSFLLNYNYCKYDDRYYKDDDCYWRNNKNAYPKDSNNNTPFWCVKEKFYELLDFARATNFLKIKEVKDLGSIAYEKAVDTVLGLSSCYMYDFSDEFRALEEQDEEVKKGLKSVLFAQFKKSPLRILEGHEDLVRDIAYSPCGNYFASGGQDRKLLLWDAHTYQPIKAIKYDGWITSLAYSPCGKHILFGSNESIVVLDSKSGDLIYKKKINDCRCVAYSPCGNFIVVGSFSEGIDVFNAHTGKQLHNLPHKGLILSLAFNPKCGQLASGGVSTPVHIWDVSTGELIRTLTEGKDLKKDFVWHTIPSIVYSPDGKFISYIEKQGAAAPKDTEFIKIVESETGNLVLSKEYAEEDKWHYKHKPFMQSLDYSPCGNYLVIGSWNTKVRLMEVATGKMLQLLDHGEHIQSVKFSPCGKFVLSGGSCHWPLEDRLKVWVNPLLQQKLMDKLSLIDFYNVVRKQAVDYVFNMHELYKKTPEIVINFENVTAEFFMNDEGEPDVHRVAAESLTQKNKKLNELAEEKRKGPSRTTNHSSWEVQKMMSK